MLRRTQKALILWTAFSLLLAPFPALLAAPGMMMMGDDCAAHFSQSASMAPQHVAHMQHPHSANGSAMPCCDGDQADKDCSHCDCNPGSCSSAKVQMSLSLHAIAATFIRTQINVCAQSVLTSQHTPPLLRPPISHFA